MTRHNMNCPRVIVRMPNWLGDCIMSLWAVRELAETFADINIEVLVRPSVSDLFAIVPFVSRVHVIPHRKLQRVSFLRKLSREQFDAGILLPNSLSSAVEMKIVSPRCIVGYRRDCRSLLLDRGIPLPPWEKTEHIVCYYSHLIRRACHYEGNPTPWMPDTKIFNLVYPDAALAEFDQLAERTPIVGNFAVMCAGAAFGPAKQWHLEAYAETARQIRRKFNMSVLLMGGRGDEEISASIASQAGDGVFSICGSTTLSGAACLLSKAKAFVGNDSGLMHLAALTGTPTIGLFFSTDTVRTAPVGNAVSTLSSGVDCSPCFKRNCEKGYICRDRITPADIISRLVSLFEKRAMA